MRVFTFNFNKQLCAKMDSQEQPYSLIAVLENKDATKAVNIYVLVMSCGFYFSHCHYWVVCLVF